MIMQVVSMKSYENHIQTQAGKKTISINRRRSIREHCTDCSAGNMKEVKECTFKDCPLYPFRMGRGKQNPKDRNKSIRRYCLWCCCDQPGEVRLCPTTSCPLYPYRGAIEKTTKNVLLLQKSLTGEGVFHAEVEREYK
jgi:hypothetical protein